MLSILVMLRSRSAVVILTSDEKVLRTQIGGITRTTADSH